MTEFNPNSDLRSQNNSGLSKGLAGSARVS
jgi:hypothetical protein